MFWCGADAVPSADPSLRAAGTSLLLPTIYIDGFELQRQEEGECFVCFAPHTTQIHPSPFSINTIENQLKHPPKPHTSPPAPPSPHLFRDRCQQQHTKQPASLVPSRWQPIDCHSNSSNLSIIDSMDSEDHPSLIHWHWHPDVGAFDVGICPCS